jgi:hypothetical protein
MTTLHETTMQIPIEELREQMAALRGVPSGVTVIAGEKYMRDTGGRLVPLATVKPQHKLEDQTVRALIGFAQALSEQIARFRGHTFDDVGTFQELLAAEYGGKRGGRKGNITLTSYDGLYRVTVQVADLLTFGPELQVAKELVDRCITAWSEGTRPEIRALIEHAFQVDKEGRINRAALFQVRRLDIDDADWQAAMRALADAIRIIGSKEYVRFHRREKPGAPWQPITIDLAAA